MTPDLRGSAGNPRQVRLMMVTTRFSGRRSNSNTRFSAPFRCLESLFLDIFEPEVRWKPVSVTPRLHNGRYRKAPIGPLLSGTGTDRCRDHVRLFEPQAGYGGTRFERLGGGGGGGTRRRPPVGSFFATSGPRPERPAGVGYLPRIPPIQDTG